MSTFLESHCKIHELESRLKKNQYLSNDCLPNFLDAQVLKALKKANQIPKRQIYPNFYHWYVLMRQFADRTLDYWLKNDQAMHHNDHTVEEVVRIISKKNQHHESCCQHNSLQKHQRRIKFKSLSDLNICEIKLKTKDSFQSIIEEEDQVAKSGSQTQKKIPTVKESVNDYLMSIKLNVDIEADFEKLKDIFKTEKVKVEQIKMSHDAQDHETGLCVRVYFQTTSKICEQLKNKILGCPHVQKIQCKKQKRNQSL